MSSTGTKKKTKLGKILLWGIVIFFALHFITDGESTESLTELFQGEKPGYTVTGPTNASPPQDTLPQPSGPAASVPFPSVPPATVPPTLPQADRLPSVPAELRDHAYLNMRGWGLCEKLTGNVTITVIFVSDPDAAWADEETAAVRHDLEAAVSRISVDADGYGAQVNISLQYKAASISETIVDGDTAAWVDSALSAVGLPDRTKVNVTLEHACGADSAPVIFVANHGGRATATSHSSGNEYAVLYENAHAFYHELSHIYGAKDFYYPADVKALAQTHIPNSIMVDSAEGVMDDFTAYLIGWTDSLSASAMDFLQATSYLTPEYIAEEKEKETYTGYVTDFPYADGIYTGYLVNGVRHGQGTWSKPDGTLMEGTFVHGSLSGQGTYMHDGAVWVGNWTDGGLNGYGTFTGDTGNRYSGNFFNGSFHGQGTYTWTDGSSYTGGFKNGSRSGRGTYRYANGAVYEGQWAEGIKSGLGVMTYADGGKYDGQWLDDKRHGQGIYSYANGAVYNGQWVNGVRSGQGHMTYANGASYEGQWENDDRNGHGTLVYADGGIYTGQWVNGVRSGQGTYTYTNADSYTGSWSEDLWNGQGTFTWTSGDKYVGEFQNGQRHGYGIYYYPSGNRYEGYWANGKQHGQGTMHYTNGTTRSGTWNNGTFVG